MVFLIKPPRVVAEKKHTDLVIVKMSNFIRRAVIKSVSTVGPGPFDTPDPFLFLVYHKDHYPAGDGKMQVPNKIGNGNDFDPKAPYRMYHGIKLSILCCVLLISSPGERIPGFPQHPHRGFETITATLDGIIDHTDSLGNAGRYTERP